VSKLAEPALHNSRIDRGPKLYAPASYHGWKWRTAGEDSEHKEPLAFGRRLKNLSGFL
jgi:hypothetical protein